MLDLLTFAGSLGSAVISISACIALLFHPVRSRFIAWIKRTSGNDEQDAVLCELRELMRRQADAGKSNQEILEIQSIALRSMLRNNITHIYYHYLNAKALPAYEKENAVKQYSSYMKLNGNSYVDVIYHEILTWEIITQ